MTEEQMAGGTGIDVVVRAARAGRGCALDAERAAQVEATYQGLLSRIRDQEQAVREGGAEREAMKARAAALASAARALVVALGFLPDGQRATVESEVRTLLAEVDGVSPDAREFVVVRRETFREMEEATREALAGPPEPEPLDTYAVVHLLGHTQRTGKLAHSRQVPGFLRLADARGRVRLINPRQAVFEIEEITEKEAEARTRPTAPWGEMVGDDDEDDYDEDEGEGVVL